MFKKSSWSRRFLLTTVAASQLISSAAPVKAMFPAGSRYFQDPNQNDAASVLIAVSASTPAPAAAAAESMEGFLERMSTLSEGDQLTSVHARLQAEKLFKNRFRLFPTMIRLFQGSPKSDPGHKTILIDLWKLFQKAEIQTFPTVENRALPDEERLSPQMLEEFTRELS